MIITQTENLATKPFNRKNYVHTALFVFGACAVAASVYIAWPALAHLGLKFV